MRSTIFLWECVEDGVKLKEHVGKASRATFYYLRQLREVRKLLTTKACKALFLPFVSGLLQLPAIQLNRLQSVLHASQTQIWLDLCRCTRQTSLQVHWLPVKRRIEFKIKCVLVLSAKSMRLQLIFPRCCFRSDMRLDCDMFLRSLQALIVLLFPVRHSGIVYRTGKLSQRLCVVECFQGRTQNIFIQESIIGIVETVKCELYSSWLVWLCGRLCDGKLP